MKSRRVVQILWAGDLALFSGDLGNKWEELLVGLNFARIGVRDANDEKFNEAQERPLSCCFDQRQQGHFG